MWKHTKEICESPQLFPTLLFTFQYASSFLGIDIIMRLSKIDCHFRASIMCKNWQQILPLGFAYILCMLLYFSGIQ